MGTGTTNGNLIHAKPKKQLQRETFRTSRLLDFCSRKELIAQTGHAPDEWPLVMLKEGVDNSLDAAEDASIPPIVKVTVDEQGIAVSDNGPGIQRETIKSMLDFSVRVSSREAYVSPTRGAQGNALKTILAMPFVLSEAISEGRVEIITKGVRYLITLKVDRIRGEPVIDLQETELSRATVGTDIRIHWPATDLARSILSPAKSRFLQIADEYRFLNPHLTLRVDWFGEQLETQAFDPLWKKWLPSNPTSPYWYSPERFERLLAAYLSHDADTGRSRTVREFISEFDGLTGSVKQMQVLDATDLKRAPLVSLVKDGEIDHKKTKALLEAMRENSKPVSPARLGVIGKDFLRQRFEELGCQSDSFTYKKRPIDLEGIPTVQETAFGFMPKKGQSRRFITGVNWSPGIMNPFRQLGKFGQSLDSVLSNLRAGREEPIVLFLHIACPRVEYTDRGKSAVVVGD